MRDLHHRELGEVRRQLVELAQRPGLEDALEALTEFVVGETAVRVVPLERGDDALAFCVRGARALLHLPSIARRSGGGVDRRQMPMRWARSSRW